MSYALGFTPEAREEFAALSPPVQEHILDHLDLLANDPTGLSTVSESAHRHQVYYFAGLGDSLITVAFQYSQDESTIVVTGIEIESF